MSNVTVTKYIENVGEEIEVEVNFDFQPAERRTWNYPGCDASLDICEIRRTDNGAELFLLKEHEDDMAEELLEDYREQRRLLYERGISHYE